MDKLVALENVKRNPSNKYTVLVYFLNKSEVIDETDVYGGIIVMGAYPNKASATEACQKIIDDTGHRQVMIIKTCQWHFLKPESYRDSTVVPALRDRMFKDEAITAAGLDLKTAKSVTDVDTRNALHEQYINMRNPDHIDNYHYRVNHLKHLQSQIDDLSAKASTLKIEIAEQLEKHPEFNSD